jgi:hypothetical protein
MKPRIVRLLKAIAPLVVVAAGGGFALSLLTGDGCGPVERGIRAGLGTWDMWETAMVAPYQQPLGAVPEGSVPVGGDPESYATARRTIDALLPAERKLLAGQAFRQFCHHCHGPRGDNRIIVGESFGFALPDLRSDDIQNLADEQIFASLSVGTKRMISLAAMTTAVERVLAIEHLRTLKGAVSRPFYPPRWVQPAEQPGGPRR